MTAIERAYEMARTGKYLNFSHIEKALRRQFNVDQDLTGKQLASDLTRLCQEARVGGMPQTQCCKPTGADPARVTQAAEPGGWRGLTYLRLHGSPQMYASTYDEAYVETLADGLKADPAAEAWCMFDNTMFGGAAANALDLQRKVSV